MTVRFQPRFSLATGAITGFEADGGLFDACEQMARPQGLLVVPIRDLHAPPLVAEVRNTLRATGFPAENLRLAIPERAIMAAGGTLKATFHLLRDMGVGLEIDQFGTGRFSVGYLRALPFSGLKIDRSFTHALGSRNDSAEIIGMILKFVEGLGISVVADGVETEEQCTLLKNLGCATAQGPWFSEALDAGTAMAFLGRPHQLHLV